MTWDIEFSSEAVKFLAHNNLPEQVVLDKIQLVLQKFAGDDINVDVKKLSGPWLGFYRIRSGKLRIIVAFNFETHSVFIERIDFRGNAYK